MSTERLESPGSIPSLSESSAPPPPDVQNQTPDVPRVAEYPFDDQYADVILRTSDNVVFHVYKSTLIYASGFFRDLFAIPNQSSTEDVGIQSSSQSASTITLDVPEESVPINSVLHWCYPIPHIDPTDITTIESILAIATKYEMAGIISYMRRPLRDLHQDSPRQVYALSCKFGYSDLAADAAKVLSREVRSDPVGVAPQDTSVTSEWGSTVSHSLYSPELTLIPAASFLRLLRFVRDGIRPSNFCQNSEPEAGRLPEVYLSINIDYPNGDLIVRSELGDSVIFKVHKQIISFSSSVLEEKIRSITDSSMGSDGLPVLELPEGSTILGLLLRSCYPSGDLDPATFDPSDIPLLAAAAVKYGVEKAVLSCKKRLSESTPTHPFRAYWLSIQCDWKEEAKNAATSMARLSIEEEYHPIMESMDTTYYYALLEFCHRYRKTLASIRSKFSNRPVDYNTEPTFSNLYAYYKEKGKAQGHYLEDVACILPFLTHINSKPRYFSIPTLDPVTHAREIYQETAEQLDKVQLQLQWGGARRSTGRGKKKRKGQKTASKMW